MLIRVLAVVLLAAALSSGAQAPVPELKVEAIDGGSVLRVRNNWSQALVAYVIELVGYPGSSYSLCGTKPLSRSRRARSCASRSST